MVFHIIEGMIAYKGNYHLHSMELTERNKKIAIIGIIVSAILITVGALFITGTIDLGDITTQVVPERDGLICETQNEVSFPDKAPWGLTELYKRRERGEAQARPKIIDTRNGTYTWTATNGVLDLAQPEMAIFHDAQCKNPEDYSAVAGGREYVRLTNGIGQNDEKKGNFGISVSYGTDQRTFSSDGKWLSLTTSGRCVEGASSCTSSTSTPMLYRSDGSSGRYIRFEKNVGPPGKYNFGWGGINEPNLLYWTAGFKYYADLFATDMNTGLSSQVATDIFHNASHGEDRTKVVRSPVTDNGLLLISDAVEIGVGDELDWQTMPVTVVSVADGPNGPKTRITFSGDHGLQVRDRLRMQGPPDMSCEGDTVCNLVGERRVVTAIVDSTSVDIADGQFADWISLSKVQYNLVDVTGFTLLYERYRQKAFIFDVAKKEIISEYFTDLGLVDDTGRGYIHNQGEEFRMHSFGMSQSGEFWNGTYGPFSAVGEGIRFRFPTDIASPTRDDVELVEKGPCEPGGWPDFGHSAFGPIADQVLIADGTSCDENEHKMSMWNLKTKTLIKKIDIPDTVHSILHARWQSNNKWMYVSFKPKGETNTSRALLRCDTDADSGQCKTIARGYVGDTPSVDSGTIRPKSSPDGTKVLLNSSEFTGRGEGPEGFKYHEAVDTFYAVSFMPQAPTTTASSIAGSLSWSIPTMPLQGQEIPINEAKGYHVYESDNTTANNCSGPWTRITNEASSQRSFNVSGRIPSGQSKCYAVTTEEYSSLESDKLGNRIIVKNSGGTFTSSNGGDEGVTDFDTTAPGTPGITLDSFKSIYGTANAYVNGLTFNPVSDSDTRYYNIYYSNSENPTCNQSTLAWSIPASAIAIFATSTGERPFFDYLADPDASGAYYGIKAIDRAGNVSECSYGTVEGDPNPSPTPTPSPSPSPTPSASATPTPTPSPTSTPTPTPVPTSSPGDDDDNDGGDDPVPTPTSVPQIYTFQVETRHIIVGDYSGIEPSKQTAVLASNRSYLERTVSVPQNDYWLDVQVRNDSPAPVYFAVYLNDKAWKIVRATTGTNSYQLHRAGLLRDFTGGRIKFRMINDTYDKSDPTNAETDRNLHIDWWRLISK